MAQRTRKHGGVHGKPHSRSVFTHTKSNHMRLLKPKSGKHNRWAKHTVKDMKKESTKMLTVYNFLKSVGKLPTKKKRNHDAMVNDTRHYSMKNVAHDTHNLYRHAITKTTKEQRAARQKYMKSIEKGRDDAVQAWNNAKAREEAEQRARNARTLQSAQRDIRQILYSEGRDALFKDLQERKSKVNNLLDMGIFNDELDNIIREINAEKSGLMSAAAVSSIESAIDLLEKMKF